MMSTTRRQQTHYSTDLQIRTGPCTGKKIALQLTTVVWYKKKKEGKSTLSKSERKTVLLLASFIPG